MKLFAVAVIGFVALAGSQAHSTHHHHHDTQTEVGHNTQEYTNDRYDQYNNNNGENQYQQRNEELNQQRNNNQESSNERLLNNLNQQRNINQESSNERFLNNQDQQNNQDLNEFSESNWNIQTPIRSVKKNSQNQAIKTNSHEVFQSENQWSKSQTSRNFNQQSQEEVNQQTFNNKNRASQNYGSSDSSESNSQDEYVNTNDLSNEIGHQVAQKMVRFFTIMDKYTASNGTIQTNQAHESFALRQHTMPMDHQQYLNINESNVYGLNHGVIKSMYLNTERNCVDLEYFFQSLWVKAKFNAKEGLKKSFILNMFNTDMNVSTELENSNRNYAHSRNGNAQLVFKNIEDSSDNQLIKDIIENNYAKRLISEIESEIIRNSYNGLVGCLRSELESTFEMPLNKKLNLDFENKKTQLSVSFVRSDSWNDDQSSYQFKKQKTVQYVAFRQNQSGNGYKLKVKVLLAKRPTWESDIVLQKLNHINPIKINNVKFSAQNIVASAVMKRVPLDNGAYKFDVEEASFKLEGLRYDIGKFDLPKNTNEKLVREVGQNLQKIMENGMSAALRQQLYKQQQICKQRPMDCNSCSRNQFNQQ
ncbi:unnamed protein product [Macrosiphum euphorbiae]|nr:unnamed protein product [Macrosiphum euphorbiae]